MPQVTRLYVHLIIRYEQLSYNVQMSTWKHVFLLFQLLLFQKQIKLGSSAENQLTNLGNSSMKVNVPYVPQHDAF